MYLQLKNTIQAEDSPDFGKEILAFALVIQPGLNAVHDRDAGKPFNQQDFERILLFTERYKNLMQAKYAYAIPNPQGAAENEGWQHISESLLSAIGTGHVPYAAAAYGRLISAYRASDVNGFNAVIREYQGYLSKTIPEKLNRPKLEFLFNQAQPFLQAMILYVIVLVFGLFSWLVWPKTLGKTAVILLVGAFLIHTFGLITRMYLQGRPPVTNLYSSAIFVGWASVLLCIILERFYKNGIGSVCGAVIGFVTLLIAHNLQLDGDTLEMLRAVLDTNGWLATHVVGEALGYSAMFLAGLIGIIYIFRGVVHDLVRRRHLQNAWSNDVWRGLFRHLVQPGRHYPRWNLGGSILGPVLGLGSERKRSAPDRPMECDHPARALGRIRQGTRAWLC